MSFREGETNDFPFARTDRAVWYAIIVHDIRFPRFDFTASKSGKKAFIEKIESLKADGQKYLLLGLWQGQWKTDIFILDEELTKGWIRGLG